MNETYIMTILLYMYIYLISPALFIVLYTFILPQLVPITRVRMVPRAAVPEVDILVAVLEAGPELTVIKVGDSHLCLVLIV